MSRFLHAIVLLYFLALVQARAINGRTKAPTTELVTPSLDITHPTQGSVHVAGHPLVVMWDGSNIPKNIQGELLLGYVDKGDLNEHLYWFLATIPDLSAGKISFFVNTSWDTWEPELKPRTDYVVAVIGNDGFGNSGDISPSFTFEQKAT